MLVRSGFQPCRLGATPLILGMTDQFQMIGIHAAPITAGVVDLTVRRYESVNMRCHDPVNGNGAIVQAHARVSTAPSSA
jgi:hypothetical protein